MSNLAPLVLDGRRVRLLPLAREHNAALCQIGLDERLWKRTTIAVQTPEEMSNYIQVALDAQSDGSALAFVVEEKSTGQVIGTSRFQNYLPKHRRIEIGFTWLALPWQGRGINAEMKLLMLRHAFESLDCHRVEFKADVENVPSRRALEKVGAKLDGILRGYMISPRTGPRDLAIYSILASEWDNLRIKLESQFDRDASL